MYLKKTKLWIPFIFSIDASNQLFITLRQHYCQSISFTILLPTELFAR